MELAALILSILALLMSMITMIVYLSTYVFSKRSIQMVPVSSMTSSGSGMMPPEIGKDFEEFEFGGPIEAALKK